MTLKKALRYSTTKKVIVKRTNTPMSILCIDYSDPKCNGRVSNVGFLLDDRKWYNYKELSEIS